MTSSPRKPTNKEISRLLNFLDDDIPTPEESDETVRRLGIDIKAMANDIRKKIEANDRHQAKARFAASQLAYHQSLQQWSESPKEPIRPRVEQEAMLRDLLSRTGPHQVAAHFQKFEEAGDQELAAMIGALRFLLETEESKK